MPPAALFRGVIAHVSVTLDDGVDASRPFAGKLTKHGARVVKKFITNGLTHLIFRGSSAAASSFSARAENARRSEGRRSRIERTMKRKTPSVP